MYLQTASSSSEQAEFRWTNHIQIAVRLHETFTYKKKPHNINTIVYYFTFKLGLINDHTHNEYIFYAHS